MERVEEGPELELKIIVDCQKKILVEWLISVKYKELRVKDSVLRSAHTNAKQNEESIKWHRDDTVRLVLCVCVCVCVCVFSAEIRDPTWHSVTNLDLHLFLWCHNPKKQWRMQHTPGCVWPLPRNLKHLHPLTLTKLCAPGSFSFVYTLL